MVLVFSAIFLWGLVRPSYEAQMKILVRHERHDPLLTPTPTQSPLLEDDQVTEEELNSEAELLQDDDILRTVAGNSGLVSRWRMPWQIWEGDDASLERAVRRLGNRLDVQPVKKSAMITVNYDSSNPRQAATVLQCLAAAYLEKHQELRRPSGQVSFFNNQMVEAGKQLQDAQLQLMEFTETNGVVSAPLERDIALKQLSDADAGYRETEISLAEERQRSKTLEAALRQIPDRATTVIRSSDNPQLLGEMKSKLLDLQLKRTELLSRFQPSYRVVQEVDQQIAEAKAAIAGEVEFPVKDVTTQLDPNHEWTKAELLKSRVEVKALEAKASASETLLADYQTNVRLLGNRAIEQEQLIRSLKEAEDKYLLYAGKREEARIGDALDRGGLLNVAIAQEPHVPALPVWSLWMFAAVGLLAGGTAGTLVAFTADYLALGFRTPEEVTAFLGAPVLASLPESTGEV